jgi:hypothetical protein
MLFLWCERPNFTELLEKNNLMMEGMGRSAEQINVAECSAPSPSYATRETYFLSRAGNP